MIMLLGVRHALSWVIMLDIINSVNKLFDQDILKLNKYKLFKFFPDNQNWFKHHIYCSECKSYIGERKILVDPVTCFSCKLKIKDIKKTSYFLTLDISSQFKNLLENPTVQPYLRYRFTRSKKNADNIEDIHDGSLYKKLSAYPNILSNENNFSFTFNTDGCQSSRSSNISIWPVYLKLNELPLKLRNKNMILAGIWVGKEKPPMNTFLHPLVNELNILSSEGVKWQKNGKEIISKIVPLCCSVDSPCRYDKT